MTLCVHALCISVLDAYSFRSFYSMMFSYKHCFYRLHICVFEWLTLNSLGSVIQMFCPAVVVIQCFDARRRYRNTKERVFPPSTTDQPLTSPPSPPPPSHSCFLSLSTLSKLSSIHCFDF